MSRANQSDGGKPRRGGGPSGHPTLVEAHAPIEAAAESFLGEASIEPLVQVEDGGLVPIILNEEETRMIGERADDGLAQEYHILMSEPFLAELSS
jgi:hypothetical protein